VPGRGLSRAPFLFSLLVALCTGRAAASAPRQSSVALDTIRVTAPRLSDAARLLLAPGFSSYIPIQSAATSGEGLAQVVASAPGVHVSTSGGPGAFATLSIRGGSACQVSYDLDGVPLRWSEFGVVNLEDLPFESLDHIEIHRGHVPNDLGSGGLSGAVHLVSDTSAGLAGRLQLATGSFGERIQSGGASLQAAGIAAHATLSHTAYQGDFNFDDNRGTLLNSADDTVRARANNALDRWRGALLLSRGRLGAGLYGFAADKGLPGLGYSQAQRTRYNSSGSAAHLFWNALGASDRPRLRTEVFYTRGATHFLDPAGEMRVGYLESKSLEEVGGARLSTAAPWGAHTVSALLEESVDHWSPEFVKPYRAARGANRAAGSLGLELRRAEGALQYTLGGRAEWWNDRGSSVDRLGRPTPALPGLNESRLFPRAAASFSPTPQLWLKAGAGTYQRLPSMAERFGIEGSQVGNAALRPERGVNGDLGALWSAGDLDRRLELEAAQFWSRATDMICLETSSARTATPQNSGKADISGEELRASVRLGALALETSATWLRALDATDNPYFSGKQLPGRPAREVHAELSLNFDVFQAALRMQHLDDSWLDRAHSAGSLVASRTLWALDASVPLRAAGLVLQGTLDNLSDRRVSDVDGYPLPGRSFRASVQWVRSSRAHTSLERNTP
jgi:iron complex outermembrane receptor protein